MSRVLLACGLLVLLAGTWYWALQPPAMVGRGVQGRPAAAMAREAVPVVALERLDRRTSPPLSSLSARNPFRSGSAEAVSPGRVAPSRVPIAPRPPAAAAIAWPRVELIGIAQGKDGDAVVRTAIISGPRGVYHVRPGDQLEGLYRVERVLDTAIDLRLVPEDRVLHLVLRP